MKDEHGFFIMLFIALGGIVQGWWLAAHANLEPNEWAIFAYIGYILIWASLAFWLTTTTGTNRGG